MLRKLALLALVFALALGATLFWLSRDGGAAVERPGLRQRMPAVGARYRPPEGVTGSEVRLGVDDLRELVRGELGETEDGRRALELTKGLRAEIGDGRIEVGLVFNISELDRGKLTEEELEAVDKVARYLPFLEDQDLYVGVSGVPVARDGLVMIADDVSVKLGFLSLPMDEMGKLFDVETRPLREELLLDLSPFRAREVEVLPGEVVIRLGITGG